MCMPLASVPMSGFSRPLQGPAYELRLWVLCMSTESSITFWKMFLHTSSLFPVLSWISLTSINHPHALMKGHYSPNLYKKQIISMCLLSTLTPVDIMFHGSLQIWILNYLCNHQYTLSLAHSLVFLPPGQQERKTPRNHLKTIILNFMIIFLFIKIMDLAYGVSQRLISYNTFINV